MKPFVLVLSVAVPFSILADEVDLPINQLPEKVQTAMKQLAGAGTISHTTKETEKDGAVIYEVSYTLEGKKFEAEVSSVGETIVVDEQIELSQAPAAVAKIVKEKTAGANIIKVEKATKGAEVFYEAEFKKGGKEHEVKVSPDGKLIAEE